MKIGELFVSLGFKVDTKDLEETEKGMERAAVKAGKLAIVVNAVNAAMLAMVDTAMKAATGLRLWEQTTGGSADSLQRWEMAAKVALIKADDLRGAVRGLQDARNAFLFGEPQNVGAWQILGVDPTQDPFVVLDRLRDRMQQVRDPNLFRGLLSKVGIEGIMPVLQLPGPEFQRFRKELTVTREEVTRLVELNREWARFKVAIASFTTQVSAALAPALGVVASWLEKLASFLTIVTQWLNSGSTAAKFARVAVGMLAVAMLALGAAIAVVTAAMIALTAAMVMFDAAAWASGIPEIILGITLVVGILVAAIAGLVLLLDDFWTAADGGQHVFDWSNELKMVDLMAKGIEKLIWLWDKLVAGFKAGQRAVEFLLGGEDRKGWAWGPFGEAWRGTDDDIARRNRENMGGGWFTPSAIRARQAAGLVQDNKIQIMIDGAQHPEATANATAGALRRELEDAAYQSPVPGY